MALSDKARQYLRHGLGSEQYGNEVADNIDSGDNPVAANVAAIGSTSDLVGVDGTGSNAAPLVETEARLDAIEAKVDAVIASLKAAGLMSSS